MLRRTRGFLVISVSISPAIDPVGFDKYAGTLHVGAPDTYTRPNGEIIKMSVGLKSLYGLRAIVEEAEIVGDRESKLPEGLRKRIRTKRPFVVFKDGYNTRGSQIGKCYHPILDHIYFSSFASSFHTGLQLRSMPEAELEKIEKNDMIRFRPSVAPARAIRLVPARIYNADVLQSFPILRPKSDIHRDLLTGEPMSPKFRLEELDAIFRECKYSSKYWLCDADVGKDTTQLQVKVEKGPGVPPIVWDPRPSRSHAHFCSEFRHAGFPLSRLENPLAMFAATVLVGVPTALESSLDRVQQYTDEKGYFTGFYMTALNFQSPEVRVEANKRNFVETKVFNIEQLAKPLPKELAQTVKTNVANALERINSCGASVRPPVTRSVRSTSVSGMIDTAGICIDGVTGADLSNEPLFMDSKFKDKIFFTTSSILKFKGRILPNARGLDYSVQDKVILGLDNIDIALDPLRKFVSACARVVQEGSTKEPLVSPSKE